jgi:uncharacterized protein YbcC (UPF0753/DUF2309 family)
MHDKTILAISKPMQKQVLQAVFCIDVRLEQCRKQLEAQHHEIETNSFGGYLACQLRILRKQAIVTAHNCHD